LSVDCSNLVRGGVVPAGRLVSVIVPAYNASATIERTLRSVMVQTYAHLEIIVVDDGSNDHTAAIVERVGREDPRIILLRQPNKGVATARNLGIAHACGAFIAPLDADDIWHPRKIEKQITVMEYEGDRIGLVYCHSRIIDEYGNIISQDGPQGEARGDVYALLVLSNFIGNASSPLIRRGCLQEVGGYDPSLRARCAQGCEDLGVCLAIAERWEIDLVPEYLVGYRRAGEKMSHNHISMARSWEIVIARARSRHPELPLRLVRWARGNFYRWLALGCLARGRACWSLYYLAIAAVYDPCNTVTLWLARAYCAQLVGPRGQHIGLGITYKIRDALFSKPPLSSVAGTSYLNADPAINDGPPMRRRDRDRQSIARSIRCFQK
jgi:glycosyltransferase involved in cell wall biosynthesis